MSFSQTICINCRFKIVSALLSGTRCVRPSPRHTRPIPPRRPLTTTPWRRIAPGQPSYQQPDQKLWVPDDVSKGSDQEVLAEEQSNDNTSDSNQQQELTPEETATAARRYFGEGLPKGALNEEQYKIYERLYGPPLSSTNSSDEQELIEEEEEVNHNADQVWLRQKTDGSLEQVEIVQDDEPILQNLELLDESESIEESEEDSWTAADARLQQDIALSLQQFEEHKNEISISAPQEFGATTERYLHDEDIEDQDGYEPGEPARTHPLTLASRFGTSPSSVPLPRAAMTGPVGVLLSNASNKHLDETAHRLFGGPGLPYSPATPLTSRTMPQKPIPLTASQSRMSEMEADAYFAAVMPGIYASVISVVAEVRRRLGSRWLENLLQKDGGPKILDAGAAGAGVLAWREVLKAEWLRMYEKQQATKSSSTNASETSAVSDQFAPPEMPPAPLGKATVLTGSAALRHRASLLLENTTFLPRLPDYVHAHFPSEGSQRKQFDIIIAPHSLWNMHENYERKERILNLWSLLDPNGGVLVLLEKGVPRGFEVIAEARSYMLRSLFHHPDAAEPLNSTTVKQDLEDMFGPKASTNDRSSTGSPQPDQTLKESRRAPARIIAPCPGHGKCPMYVQPGIARQRKDYCHFSQRFIRPAYYQRMLGAKGRNYEDVEFSYIAVQKGVEAEFPAGDKSGKVATEQAFAGYDTIDTQDPSQFPSPPKIPQALPRILKAPLKRKGHVHLDVCLPTGTLERWTVPRSFGRQAYRDARKARWGDLWALGAKQRDERGLRLGKVDRDLDGEPIKHRVKQKAGPRGKLDAERGKGAAAADIVSLNAAKAEEQFGDDPAGAEIDQDEEMGRPSRKVRPKLRGRFKARTRRRQETRALMGGAARTRSRGRDSELD